MEVVGREVLEDLKRKHPDVRGQVDSWLAEALEAEWKTPMEVSERYPSASHLENNCVVFNLKGNKYRLLVRLGYNSGVVHVLRAGTHRQYDRWNL